MNDNYIDKFDSSKIDDVGRKSLENFHKRRKIFDDYLKKNNIKLFTCPSCGYPILAERWGYEICTICGWEDDDQDDSNADEIMGGPNKNLSLTESRLQIGKVFHDLEERLKGKINLDPKEVLKVLNSRRHKLELFMKKIIHTNTDDPAWEEYSQLEKSSLRVLIKSQTL